MPNATTAQTITVNQASKTTATQPYETTQIKLNVSGWSPNLKNYYIGLFEELLIVAEPKFGPHQLQPVNLEISTKRAVLMSDTGELPLGFATRWNDVNGDDNKSTLYHQPYLNRLLGLRQIIVPTRTLEKFKAPSSFTEFKQLKPGQGAGWPDSKIYKQYGINVIEAKSYEHLFPMLLLDRFDYIPLSILEVAGVMAEINKNGHEFSVVPNLYIYYPIPIYIRSSKVSAYTDTLVSHALAIYFSEQYTQQREALFNLHFSHIQPALPQQGDTIFYLDNHALSSDANEEFMSGFKQRYSLGSNTKPE